MFVKLIAKTNKKTYNKVGDKMKRKIALLIATLGSIGVLSTMIGSALDNPLTPFGSALGTLRYFTIQSNIIVIVYFWLLFLLKFDKHKKFNDSFGGVTVYISITFIVFAIMLARTWNPSGISQVGNILNHYVVPLLTLGYLIWFRKSYNFRLSNIKSWIIYPILYVIFVLIHGAFTQDYLYPFFEIDTIKIGYFLLAFLGIVTLFFILSISYIFLTKNKDL